MTTRLILSLGVAMLLAVFCMNCSDESDGDDGSIFLPDLRDSDVGEVPDIGDAGDAEDVPDAEDAEDVPDAEDAEDVPDAGDAEDVPDAEDAEDVPDAEDDDAFSCQHVDPQIPPPTALKIATYNLNNLFDEKTDDCDYSSAQGWNPTSVSAKISNLAQVIKEIDADIIGINEVENRALLKRLRDAISAAGGPEYPYLAYAEGGPGSNYEATHRACYLDIALMSRFPLIAFNSEECSFKRELNQEITCSDRQITIPETRPALSAEVDLDNDAQGDMLLLVNHWISNVTNTNDLCTPAQRHSRAAQQIRGWVHDYIDEDVSRPVIILGDLNSEETETALSVDLSAELDYDSLTDAHQLYNSWGELDLSSSSINNNSYYYSSDRKWYRIDHIIVSANLREGGESPWRLVRNSTVTFHPDYMLTSSGTPLKFSQSNLTGYSDHLPVIIQLERAPQSTPSSP